MLLSEWEDLKSKLKSNADVTTFAKENNTYSYETLITAYQQIYSRRMAAKYYLTKQFGRSFVARFDAGKSLMDIADWIDLSPVMIVRRVLELKLKIQRKKITALLRDPSKIKDERLRKDVQICISCDDYSGPGIDRIRNVLGLEFELLLIEHLRNIRVEFESEQDLRDRGCHKTPDILLQVPAAFCGKVVRWIDSKAKFGDESTLNKDYSDSISSYVGRFGPGMVIYWFGIIEDCPSPILNDTGVLVVDCFPSNIQFLPGACMPEPSEAEQIYTVD